MLTILYAMICAAIALRVATFNRNGGDYRPLPALLALDNVVLAPHIASGTHETRRAMADLVLHNLQQFIATGRPAAEVPWSAAQ